MKIEFKHAEADPGHQLVWVNEILEGEFYFDNASQCFRYIPTLGNEISINSNDADQARQQLIGELSRLYH